MDEGRFSVLLPVLDDATGIACTPRRQICTKSPRQLSVR
jgi:hypothetical protein